MGFSCPYCESEDIERVSNSDITICYSCHKWFEAEEVICDGGEE